MALVEAKIESLELCLWRVRKDRKEEEREMKALTAEVSENLFVFF